MNTQVRTFNINWKLMCKVLLLLCIAVALFHAPDIFAQEGSKKGIGEITGRVTETFEGIATLMVAVSYVAGIGFVVASLFKFKQHKDNPTQIPLGTPLALLIIGIVLVFLPAIFQPAGETIFGEKPKTGYPGSTIELPGKGGGGGT